MKSRWKLVCAVFDSCNRITAACLNTLALRQLSRLVSAMLESSTHCPYSREKELCNFFFLSFFPWFFLAAAAESWLTPEQRDAPFSAGACRRTVFGALHTWGAALLLPCCVPVKLRRCPSTLCPSFPAGAALLHPTSGSAPTFCCSLSRGEGKRTGWWKPQPMCEAKSKARVPHEDQLGSSCWNGSAQWPQVIVLPPSLLLSVYSSSALGKFYFSWAACELVSRKRHPCKQSFVCLESFWYCLTSFNTDAPNSRMAF